MNQKVKNTWLRIFNLANEIYKRSPWNWMDETDVFGIEIPENSRLYFMSIMGSGGQHYALSAYEGPKAIGGVWELQDNPNNLPPQTILTIPQLMLSYESRKNSDKRQLQIIKESGYPAKGLKALPNLLHYIPGYVPSIPEESMLYDMVAVLEQSLDVIDRARHDINFLSPGGHPDNVYLIRKARDDKGNSTWHDEYREIGRAHV